MKKVIFYLYDGKQSEIIDYLKKLEFKADKTSRINSNKIYEYIDILSRYGISCKEPFVKYLGNKIWELRPLKHRITFYEDKDCYVLLTHFIKKTRRTPNGEIERTNKYLIRYLGGKDNDE